MPSRARKMEYFTRMEGLIDEYEKILIVSADHVGSSQFQQIRIALRGSAVVLMGKNTMMRKCIATYMGKNPGHQIENLVPLICGNIGLIFTNGELADIKQVIEDNRVPAAAKAGVVAECNVVVPPGPTGCDPGQTSWFQALNVPTKISKGQIEIISELKLVSKGDKVGGSEAALLQKLNLLPFTYGLILTHVYDKGNVYNASALDLTEDDLVNKFTASARTLAAISLIVGTVNIASLPHSIGNAVKTLIAISAMTGYTFSQMDQWKPLLGSAEEAAVVEAETPAAE